MRSTRKQAEGLIYHVINRGARRKNIFLDVPDFEMFISYMITASEKFEVTFFAYCLMSNHYHFLIKTPLNNISVVMQYINGNYSKYFNKKYSYDGPLFRGRFKSIIVSNTSYLIYLSKYIHLNPFTAHITQFPATYPWSSYAAYLGESSEKHWLDTRYIGDLFSNENSLLNYRQFVECS